MASTTDHSRASSEAVPGFAIEGVRINAPSMEAAVSSVVEAVREGRAFSLYTLNLDHCVKLRDDAAFRDAYRRARIVTADGFPIVALARLFGAPVTRTTGADLIQPLCAEAARQGIPVFLLGTSDPVLGRAAEALRRLHPGLEIAGSYAPSRDFEPDSAEADQAIERVRASGARICVVALGAPKQEVFADRASRRLDGVGFACFGAALDFIAGEQIRAPMTFQKLKLEWLWRLAHNPRRLAVRYARCAALLARYVASVPFALFGSSRVLGRA